MTSTTTPPSENERAHILAWARANRRGAGDTITAAEYRRLEIESDLAGLRLALRRELGARRSLGPEHRDQVHAVVDEILGGTR